MRKAIIGNSSALAQDRPDDNWLSLDSIASVEVSSEDPSFPIEAALGGDGAGWRASGSGEQRIRIVFDEPVSLHRIHLSFRETQFERTQEFVVKSTAASGAQPVEVARQQWNFSPGGSTIETEDFAVDLKAVTSIEVVIQPDISHKQAVATLEALRLA